MAVGELGVLWGYWPTPQMWLFHSPQFVLWTAMAWRRAPGRQIWHLLEPPQVSQAMHIGFPEAPGCLGGVGSVSVLPCLECLAGMTLRFMHFFGKCMLSPYCVPVPCSEPIEESYSSQLPPWGSQDRGFYSGLLLPSVSPVPWKS